MKHILRSIGAGQHQSQHAESMWPGVYRTGSGVSLETS